MAVALSLALVVVAFVARDVVLRLLRDRARERGALRERVTRLSAVLAEQERLAGRIGALEHDRATLTPYAAHVALSEKVEKLVAREQLKGMGGR